MIKIEKDNVYIQYFMLYLYISSNITIILLTISIVLYLLSIRTINIYIQFID